MNDEFPDVTMRQRQLVANVLSGGFATQAEAGIASGYSKRSAHSTVARALKLPHVVDYMSSEKQRMLDEAQPTALVVRDVSDKPSAKRSAGYVGNLSDTLHLVARTRAGLTAALADEEASGNMDLNKHAAAAKLASELALAESKLQAQLPEPDETGADRLAMTHWRGRYEQTLIQGIDLALHHGEAARERVRSLVEDAFDSVLSDPSPVPSWEQDEQADATPAPSYRPRKADPRTRVDAPAAHTDQDDTA